MSAVGTSHELTVVDDMDAVASAPPRTRRVPPAPAG